MHEMKYVSARGEEVELDGDLVWSGTADGLRGRKWTYSIGRLGLKSATLDARKTSIECHFSDEAEADRFRLMADRDVRERMPGTVWVDEWSRPCYVLESSPSDVSCRHHAEKLTVVLLGSIWRKERRHSFPVRESQGSDGGFDYPHDWRFDYMRGPEPRFIDGMMRGESDFRLVIYGPVKNPVVTIKGNVYSLKYDVPAGGYVVVDSSDFTIVAVTRQGGVSNAFKAGVRGSGKGGGSYIFQPIPEGVCDVVSDGSFGFDLIVYEGDTEPPWML